MDVIFVFGSNLAGRHGKGAALFARQRYGAKFGEGKGRTGNAYAIPTKDEHLRVLPLSQISLYIQEFVVYAWENPNCIFMLTPIGTGLAGYSKDEILSLIREAAPVPNNILFTKEWFDL